MERLFFGAYWYFRPASIRIMAEKIYEVMHALSSFDSRLGVLQYETDKKIADKLFDFSAGPEIVEKLANAILDNKKRDILTYHPGTVPDIDFCETVGHIASFTVPAVASMQLSFSMGINMKEVPNSMLIKFPKDFRYDYQYIHSLLDLIVPRLQPDRAVMITREFQASMGDNLKVGWFNYYADSFNLSGIKEKIDPEPFHGGQLFCATNPGEVFDTGNLQHVSQAKALLKHLECHEKKGLLNRIKKLIKPKS